MTNQTVNLNCEIITVPHSRLVPNPKNRMVGRDKSKVKANAASIKAVGILQNLVVSQMEGGMYLIEAGNGRYESVELLIAAGELTPEFSYPCKVNNSGFSAEAIMLIENSHREGLHPVDEFTSFARLINADEMKIKEVANAFSVSQKYVKQRMKLASLAPKLITAFKDGKMDLDEAEAFTLTDDPALQLSVWEMEKNHPSRHRIRQLVTENKMQANNSLVSFVGLQQYKKAGGNVIADLFTDASFLGSPEIIYRLAQENLDKGANKLKKLGWSWVEAFVDGNVPSGRVHPGDGPKTAELQAMVNAKQKELDDLWEIEEWSDVEHKKEAVLLTAIDELETKMEASAVFSDDDRSIAGCVVTVTNGELSTIRGVVKDEDAKRLSEGEKSNQGDGVDNDSDDNRQEYSQTLKNDLSAYRSMAIKAELCRSPEVAKDLLLFTLCNDLLAVGYFGRDISITAHPSKPVTSREDIDSFNGTVVMRQTGDSLSLAWLGIDDEREKFDAMCNLSNDEKDALLAYVVAQAFIGSLADQQGGAMTSIMERLNVPFREHWTPNASNFFSRLKRPDLNRVAAELCGEEWSSERSSMKKGDLASAVSSVVANDDGTVPSGQQGIIESWLPKGF